MTNYASVILYEGETPAQEALRVVYRREDDRIGENVVALALRKEREQRSSQGVANEFDFVADLAEPFRAHFGPSNSGPELLSEVLERSHSSPSEESRAALSL